MNAEEMEKDFERIEKFQNKEFGVSGVDKINVDFDISSIDKSKVFLTREQIERQIEVGLIPGIQEYVKKAGAKGVIIGISGGIDSAVVATLAVKALGDFWVKGVYMPCRSDLDSKYSDEENQDKEDAFALANWLGIEISDIDLTTPFMVFRHRINLVNGTSTGQEGEISKSASANMKARMRMTTLYAMKEDLNYLCIGTGNKTELLIGYMCYDDKTRALTTDGLKYYHELKIGDTIFSLNMSTKELEEKSIKAMHIFDYNSNLFVGKNKGIDFSVTPNHRMVLQNVHDNSKIFFSPLDKYLENHKYLHIPFANNWQGTESILVNKFDIEINDLMYLIGLFIGDGCRMIGKTTHTLKHNSKKRDKKTGKFIKTNDSENILKQYENFIVHFSIPENNKNNARKKLEDILNKYNIKWHKGGIGVKIAFAKSDFYDLFDGCGSNALEKKIPKYLLQYPSKNLKYLFQGLIDSDGDKNENYYTSSFSLVQQFIELCFKLGKSANYIVRTERESEYKGKKIKSKTSFVITTCNKIKSRTISKDRIEKIHYNGKIWCPEIPDNENLLVERNGKFYFCGNTKYGDGGVDFEPIGQYYKTEIRLMADVLGIKNAVPSIVNKAPSARLTPGQTDEDDMGATYEEVDYALWCIENSVRGPEEIIPLKRRMIEKIIKNEHKRKAPLSILGEPYPTLDGSIHRFE